MDHPNNVCAVSREHGSYQLWDVRLWSQEHHLPSQSATGVALERREGFGDLYTSHTTREEVEGNNSWEKQSTLKCLQLENKACKV